jgi:hypothetical protein
MNINLYPHQKKALDILRTGSILWGGVGSGKSLTGLVYYYTKECEGSIEPYSKAKAEKSLYIITTANKRDKNDWEKEAKPLKLKNIVIDSWNNIKKYITVTDAFFIFDEQKVVGSGAWVKSFLKIVKNNKWILLSATPGDTWLDYIPVFVANGFYKNRTEFIRRHVVYDAFSKFPKINRFMEEEHLQKLKERILVKMETKQEKHIHTTDVIVPYNKELYKFVKASRFNPYTSEPIKTPAEYCYTARKVVNSDPSRIAMVKELALRYRRVIVFYNFDYELMLLRSLTDIDDFTVAEYNGHNHQPIPDSLNWIYLVQYTAGAEGWNCIEANTIIFYSLNYSYKITTQAAGRIDRINSSFFHLFYFFLKSESPIDRDVMEAYLEKRKFNEADHVKKERLELA